MEHRPLILAFLVALVISCASGVERQSERRRQCPDPNSYGRNCFIYRDQCKNSRQCQPRRCQQSGQRCCLVAGCGHECVDLLANNSVCPAPDSFGRVCIQYHDQCQSSAQCSAGKKCCLVAGCGKECM